jgi:HSP20 family protein
MFHLLPYNNTTESLWALDFMNYRTNNIEENDTSFTISLDLPGVQQSDIDIAVANDELVLNAVRNKRTLTRAYQLSEHVDQDNIEAALKNGVLTITLLKKPEIQPRKIKVKV